MVITKVELIAMERLRRVRRGIIASL